MKKLVTLMATSLMVILTGCSTTAYFKVPANTDIVVKGQRAFVKPGDERALPKIKIRPFFWNSMSGIRYTLVKKDKIVKEGKLPARFRVASIFWPPYALLYWPVGFQHNCFDVTKEYVERCTLSPVEN